MADMYPNGVVVLQATLSHEGTGRLRGRIRPIEAGAMLKTASKHSLFKIASEHSMLKIASNDVADGAVWPSMCTVMAALQHHCSINGR